MNRTIVKKAAESFFKEDYVSALSLYRKAAEVLGEELVRENIRICQKRLGYTKKKSFINEYFDNVYVVNLKHKVKDRLTVAKHLKDFDVDFELFEATNGYRGEPLKKWEEYLKRPLGSFKRYPSERENEIKRGKSYLESAGAIGYIYTYINILKDAKYKGYKRFLILEDDVILIRDFKDKLKKFISDIDSDWKVLQFGASQYGWSGLDEDVILSQGYYHPRRIQSCHTCGSFAIAFDSSIIDELIEAESAFEAPFDHLPMGEIYERYLGKCFTAYPNIVMPDVAESTIRGGRCQIEHSKRVKWRLEEFDYPPKKPSINVLVESSNQLKYYEAFDKISSLPFSLRLFKLSRDGLRPVHNLSVVDSEEELTPPPAAMQLIPLADYNLSLDKRSFLSESELIEYVEFKVGVAERKNSSFLELTGGLVDVSGFVSGRVSVIIPTYKRPENLLNALRSVAEQDYKDVEIVVVNDNGSESVFNEETKAIVNKVKAEYKECNIVYIEHEKNRNGAAARNTGFLNSTGEYISFLDDDDIYLQGRLSRVIEKLRSSSYKVGAVYCGFLGWNSPENDLERYKEGDLTLDILLLDYKKHYLHTNTATYKRSAVIALNGFDESYRRHQDLEFNLRFFELYHVESVKNALVRLNPHPSIVSNKVFNIDMLNLKTKFLGQFDHQIHLFGSEVAQEIYKKHWLEVRRYLSEDIDLSDIPYAYKSFFNSQCLE